MTKRTIWLTSPRTRDYACRAIQEAPTGWICRIAEPTRTDEQNRKMWPMIQDMQRQIPEFNAYSAEDIKLRFLNALGVEMRFLPTLEGQGMFPVGHRSSTLTVDQFSALLELMHEYGARHNVEFTA